MTNDSLSGRECVLAPPIVAIRLFAVTHCRAEQRKIRQGQGTSSFIVGTSAVGVLRLFSPSVVPACENVIRYGSLGMF